MNYSRLRVLVLYAHYTETLSYFNDWLDAFTSFPSFECTSVNLCKIKPVSLVKKIAAYELIVLLHSTISDTLRYILPIKNILNKRKGKLLAFVGNEVNLPGVTIGEKIKFLQDIEAEFIGTQLPLDAGKWLYEQCVKSTVIALPHALNPNTFKPVIPQEKRKIDIGVRSFRYPVHLGDNERNKLMDYFLTKNFDSPFIVDIDTNPIHRFRRDTWAEYLNNCKGTIATESGSYFLERDDTTVLAIQRYLLEKQKESGSRIVRHTSKLQKIYDSSPHVLKQCAKRIYYLLSNVFNIKHEFLFSDDANFSEIYDLFFKNHPKSSIYTKAISSRHFEAIGTKTCLIMFEGRFNNILTADEHYLALEKNFSNINDVLSRFRDSPYRNSIVNLTYDYVMEKHTYKNRMADIQKLMNA